MKIVDEHTNIFIPLTRNPVEIKISNGRPIDLEDEEFLPPFIILCRDCFNNGSIATGREEYRTQEAAVALQDEELLQLL